jgi:hypothetical protein
MSIQTEPQRFSECCACPDRGDLSKDHYDRYAGRCAKCGEGCFFYQEGYHEKLANAAPKLLELLKDAARYLPVEFNTKGECLAKCEEYYHYVEIERFVADLEGREPTI